MIDSLISNKKIKLKRSCILKVMNFLILEILNNFFEIFWIEFEFI